ITTGRRRRDRRRHGEQRRGRSAIDNYFTGAVTDAIGSMTFSAGTPRFAASTGTVSVPAGGSATLGLAAVSGGRDRSPNQAGLLLLQRDAIPGEESGQILVS